MATEKCLKDANALIAEFEWLQSQVSSTTALEIQEHIQRIKDAPTVDAVEVVYARWKYYHKQNIAVCTNCSFERDLDANFGRAISCPNCGAKMDGEEV